MSTRSRRSAGGDAPALNPTMIQLLDTSRLKKELQARGLATNGSKQMLADRLSDAVILGKSADEMSAVPVATPKTATKAQRKKPVVKVEPVALDEACEPETTEKAEEVEVSKPVVAPKKEVRTTRSRKQPPAAQPVVNVKSEPVENAPNTEQLSAPEVIPAPSQKRKSATKQPATQATSKRRKTVKPEPLPVVNDDDDEDVPLLDLLSPKAVKMAPVADVPSESELRTSQPVVPVPEIDSDEDIPLLSQLSPQPQTSAAPSVAVVKEEGHRHGTRSKNREEASTSTQAVISRVEHGALLLNSDDFGEDASSSAVAVPPRPPSPITSTLPKGDSDWRPAPEEKPKVQKKEKRISVSDDKATCYQEKRPAVTQERSRSTTVRPPAMDRVTITDKWAQKVAEHKKAQQLKQAQERQQANTSSMKTGIEPESTKSTAARTEEQKRPHEGKRDKPVVPRAVAKPRPLEPSSSSVDDLLGSIMVDQSTLLGEKRRRTEESEREKERMREEKERRMTAFLEQNQNAAQAPSMHPFPTTSSGIRSRASSSILRPPPPPPKKTLIPPPPPPKKNAAAVCSPEIPPPPPPPPPAPATSANVKSEDSRPKVVPPPPPRGPLPAHVKLEKEIRRASLSRESSRHGSVSTSNRGSETASPRPCVPAVPVEAKAGGGAESELVESVTQALLLVLGRRRKQQQDDQEVQDCLFSLLSRVETNIQLISSEEAIETTPAVGYGLRTPEPSSSSALPRQEEEQEYDPFETTIVDGSFTEYVPSAVRPSRVTRETEYDSDIASLSSDEPMDYVEQEDEEDEEDNQSGDDGDEREELSEPAETTAVERAAAGKDAKNKENERSVAKLLENPRDLLKRASAVFESFGKEKVQEVERDKERDEYSQVPLREGDYEEEEEEKPAPDYHGEPVPSDDDDMLFEIAAGISKPKKKKEVVIEEEKLPSDETIEPDYYNADLHIKGAKDKNWMIEPENADGLALMWGGVRSNYGIRLPFRDVRNCSDDEVSEEKEDNSTDSTRHTSNNSNKSRIIAFQIKIMEFLSTKHLPFEESDPHDVRVGFSLRTAPNILGEHMSSYCMTSLGKKAAVNEFVDYGTPFHQNDVVTACLDLDERSISFWVNDECLGTAFKDLRLPDGDAIYPHICVKNCAVAVNFGDFPEGEENWNTNPIWRFPTSLGRGDLERSPKAPESKADCTVLMMVGLPGVGKTTWVRQYLRDHPTEQWTVIESENVMSAMKVNGVSRKRAHHGRWDMVMGMIGKSLQRSILLAARRRRNYIIDMTNTSRDVRKRRLQLFEEFRRKCVVIIPSDEEMLDRQARQARQEGTAMMPPEAMLEMKAQISIPAPDQEPIEDVYFIEPPIHRIQDAIDIVARYNEEARPWYQKKYRRRRSQNVGLGPDRDQMRDNNKESHFPYKRPQPLTVLAPLRLSITSLDDGNITSNEPSPSPLRSAPPTSMGSAFSNSPATTRDYSVPPPTAGKPVTSHDVSMPPPPKPLQMTSMNTSVPPPPTTSLAAAVANDFSKPPPTGDMFAASRRPSEDVTSSGIVDTSLPPPSMGAQNTPSGSAKPTVSVDTASFSTPPPAVNINASGVSSSGARPMVRVSIEDLPPVAIPPQSSGLSVLHRPPPAPPLFEDLDTNIELDEEDLRVLRESRPSTNANPIVAEAVMRAKLRALQMKKLEKRTSTPGASRISVVGSVAKPGLVTAIQIGTANQKVVESIVSPVQTSPSIVGQPINTVGAGGSGIESSAIPTIGTRTPISIDTSFRSNSTPSSRPSSLSGSSSPLTRPMVARAAPSPLTGHPQQSTSSPMTPVGNLLSLSVPPPMANWNAPPPQMVSPAPVQYGMGMDYSMPSPAGPPPSFAHPPPQPTAYNMSMPPPPMMTMNVPPPDLVSSSFNGAPNMYSPAGAISWPQRKSSG